MADNRIEEPQTPSILEDLLRRSRAFVEGVIADHFKASVDRVLDWTLRRVITSLVASAFFVTAVVFLLVAGTEGLKQVGAPPWVAYLSLAFVGALGGGLLLRRPKERCDHESPCRRD